MFVQICHSTFSASLNVFCLHQLTGTHLSLHSDAVAVPPAVVDVAVPVFCLWTDWPHFLPGVASDLLPFKDIVVYLAATAVFWWSPLEIND